jgi:hypothetical protein
VIALSDYIAEHALDEDAPGVAARCGAVVTKMVPTRTTLLLLRLRSQIGVDALVDGKRIRQRTLLAEEAVGIALIGSTAPRVLEGADGLSVMAAEPTRNMDADEKAFEVQESLDAVTGWHTALDDLARRRADELLADHARVREASRQRSRFYSVEPCLPADVIGCFVLVPA